MNADRHVHDELSAYLDGELDHAARAAVDAHLPGCASCRATLDALRATIADLALLSEPEPSAFESQMLRRRLQRERARPARLVRAAAAVSAAAAVLAGIVVISNQPALDGSGGKTLDASGPTARTYGGLVPQDRDYTAAEVKMLLDPPAPASTGGSAVHPQADLMKEEADDAYTTGDDDAVARCASAIGVTDAYSLQTAIAARFRGEPVLILVYAVADDDDPRREVWVLTRDDCTVRYFAQRDG